MFKYSDYDLKPCPFCGSKDSQLFFRLSDDGVGYGNKKYRIEAVITCCNCNLEIPSPFDHCIYSSAGMNSYITPEEFVDCAESVIKVFNTRAYKEDSEDE